MVYSNWSQGTKVAKARERDVMRATSSAKNPPLHFLSIHGIYRTRGSSRPVHSIEVDSDWCRRNHTKYVTSDGFDWIFLVGRHDPNLYHLILFFGDRIGVHLFAFMGSQEDDSVHRRCSQCLADGPHPKAPEDSLSPSHIIHSKLDRRQIPQLVDCGSPKG